MKPPVSALVSSRLATVIKNAKNVGVVLCGADGEEGRQTTHTVLGSDYLISLQSS